MGKLHKYSMKSSLMRLSFEFGDEKINFNLFKELDIDEDNIDDHLKSHPASYAFLSMLHKKVVNLYSQQQRRADKLFAKAFVKWKSTVDTTTGRVFSKELAKEKANLDILYNKAKDKEIEYQGYKEELTSAVRAFEVRKDILQTLSANQRREK